MMPKGNLGIIKDNYGRPKNREVGIIVGIVRIVNKRRDFSRIVISRMTQLSR